MRFGSDGFSDLRAAGLDISTVGGQDEDSRTAAAGSDPVIPSLALVLPQLVIGCVCTGLIRGRFDDGSSRTASCSRKDSARLSLPLSAGTCPRSFSPVFTLPARDRIGGSDGSRQVRMLPSSRFALGQQPRCLDHACGFSNILLASPPGAPTDSGCASAAGAVATLRSYLLATSSQFMWFKNAPIYLPRSSP